jgi:hypothetical protein
MENLKKYTVEELCEMTNEVRAKKKNRYVTNWYKLIMDEVEKGEYTVNLYCCDWDCEEGEPNSSVLEAIETIKTIFKGIKIEEDGDDYCASWTATWDNNDVD